MIHLLLIIGKPTKMHAQYYPASVPNQWATNTKPVVNMGNDVINYTNNGVNETVKTIVYDGDTPGMFFEFLQAGSVKNSGVTVFNYTDVVDPDVALVAKNVGGIWRLYALVSYTRLAGGVYLEIQSFNFISQTFSLSQLLNIGTSSTVQIRASVNIDSDQQDRFAVTWDEQGGNGDVYVYGGYINGAGSFIFSPAAVAIPVPGYCGATPPSLPPIQPLSQPDISIFSAGGGGIANCIVNICHLDAQGDLHVNVQRFLDVINGVLGGGWSLCVEAQNGDVYNKPRIACQRYNATAVLAQTGISMVYEISNPGNGTSHIGSTTSYLDLSLGTVFGFVNTYVLTDGTYPMAQPLIASSINLLNIGSAPYQNSSPVVTYNRKSGVFNATEEILLVAWNTYDGNTTVPVSLMQLANGTGIDLKVSSSPVSYAGNYLEIPFSPSGQESTISISGEQTNNMLYSWFDFGNFDVRYKSRNYGLPLRLGQSSDPGFNAYIHENILKTYFSKTEINSEVELHIYSVLGGEVYSGVIHPPANFDLSSLSSNEGSYFLMLNSGTDQITLKWMR